MMREIDKLIKELKSSGSRAPTKEELVEEQTKRNVLNTLFDKKETF